MNPFGSDVFSMAAVKILTWVINMLPDFAVENIPALETSATLLNIFAWSNYLLPSGLIITLVAITTSYYAFKLIYNGLKVAKDFIF